MGLAAQWLLGDERVRPDGAGVNLVRHQMAQFHHVNVANHHFLIERIACASIKKARLTVFLYPPKSFFLPSIAQIFADLFLLDSIENRRSDFESEGFGSNSKVSFQYLANVHAARHAERVEHNVHRCSIRKKRHVFFGNDAGDNAFIPVAAGHLIAHAQFALAGDINFDLLDDAWIDVVATLHPIHGVLAFKLQLCEFVLVGSDDLADFVADRARIDLDVIVNHRQLSQQGLRDFAVRRDNDFAVLGIHHVERNLLAQ